MHAWMFKRFSPVLVVAFVILLWCVGVFAAGKNDQQAQAMSSASQPPAASQFVGADTCKGCHEEVVNHFAANPHWNSTFKVDGTEVHSCETCHGPGQAHAEGGGDKSKIYVFADHSPADISKRCLTCHQATQEHGNFTRSQHFKNGVSCIGCHSPHHAREKNALLLDDQPTLCYRCHTETKADFAKPYRHRVNEKLITCNDCHNVHGGYTLRRSLRTTANDDQVCFKCHRDKQGPFLFEHMPVKTEGCVSCHTPHGSTNPRLLRVYPVNILCAQCHNFTTNNASPQIPSFHNQGQKYQACTMCHPTIHGSNGAETFEY